jgi:hypothetical protein
MEFIIQKKKKKDRVRNSFRLIITFMIGDADGYEDVKFTFQEDKLNEPLYRKELEEYISFIQSMIDKDKHGRTGICEFEELISRYGEDVKRYFEYYGDDDDEMGDLKHSQFCENFPTEQRGDFYASPREIKMIYFDKDGDEFPVKIK